MDATELLEKAHDILVERGVHRGDFVDPHEGKAVCAMGALSLAAGAEVMDVLDPELLWGDVNYTMTSISDVSHHVSHHVYMDAIERLQDTVGGLIGKFNDDPANSDEDIILAMKRAAHDG